MDYRPLNHEEIRLVVLLPRCRNNTIECRIIHSTISQKPNYEALSYEWGNSEPTETIIIDRIDKNIPPNLWSALYHLRLQEQERVLWIDALCINQMDTIERNHQVQLMGQIYSGSQCVVVWLGPIASTHDEAIKSLFQWIDECSKVEKRTSTFLTHYYPGMENLRVASAMRFWKDLGSHVCSCTYWQRTWIVQEVILARRLTIQLGRWTADWDGLSFLEWGLSLFPHNQLIRQVENSVAIKLQEQRRLRQLGFGGSLESLLDLTKSSLCSDSRDAVYSLLNIARDCDVVADYSKSLPEVYETVLVAMGRSPDTTMPFSQLLQECIGERISFPLPIHHKSNSTRTGSTFSVQCSIGILAHCRYVGQPWTDNPASKSWTPRRIDRLSNLELSEILAQMATKHEKWALSCEQGGRAGINSECLPRKSRKQGFEDMLQSGKTASDEGYSWDTKCVEALQNYSVFETEGGIIGLAPKSAKAGDRICSFEGSKSIAFVDNHQDIRIPENGETYGMIVSKTRNTVFDIFPDRRDGHQLGHDKFSVWLDLASLQTLTQPGRPVYG